MVEISTRTILKVLLFGGLIFLLYFLRDIVVILLMSIVVASFVESGVKKLRRFHLNRVLSGILIYTLGLVFFAVILYVVVPVFVEQTSQFIAFISQYIPSSEFLNNFQASAVQISSHHSVPEIVAQVSKFFENFGGGLFTTATSVLWSLTKIVLIIVISFYLSIQERGVENFLKLITPPEHENYIVDLWQRTERKIGLWFQGQLLLGAIVGVLIYAGLLALDVQYALLIALAAAFLELIPFGMILAVVPALYFAFLSGGITLAATTAVLYFVVQQLEAHILTPLVVHKVVGVSPLVVILSLLVGAKLGGIYGIILSIPVAVCLLEFISDVERKKFGQA